MAQFQRNNPSNPDFQSAPSPSLDPSKERLKLIESISKQTDLKMMLQGSNREREATLPIPIKIGSMDYVASLTYCRGGKCQLALSLPNLSDGMTINISASGESLQCEHFIPTTMPVDTNPTEILIAMDKVLQQRGFDYNSLKPLSPRSEVPAAVRAALEKEYPEFFR